VRATTISIAGCATTTPYGGLSMHSKKLDEPDINLSTGLGILGAEYQHEDWKDLHLFCEHVSGLQTSEIGAGLNHCGFKLRK
jgi:hypothetical protein